ncbi:MAG: hypothetical protein Alpg2KO_06640 [Alphaproteobacteria bacterium]
MPILRRGVARRRGATLLEYAVLVGLVSVVALVAITGTGSNVKSLFGTTNTALVTAAETGSGASSIAAPASSPVPTPSLSFDPLNDPMLPSNVTLSPTGYTIDLAPFITTWQASPDDLRYDATISQTATFSRRRTDLPDSSYSASLNVGAYYYTEAFPTGFGLNMVSDSEVERYPESLVTASGERLNRPLPDDILRIQIRSTLTCPAGSTICSVVDRPAFTLVIYAD